MAPTLEETLIACQNPDPTIRKEAEIFLKQAEDANFAEFLMALAQELATESKDKHVRQLAGLHFKNLLAAKDSHIRATKTDRWKQLDPNVRAPIKSVLLQILVSGEVVARHTAGQACAEVASIELPYGQWPEFVPALLERVKESDEGITMSSLECLGYTCEIIQNEDGNIQQSVSDLMLTAIINGLDKGRSDQIRYVAAIALRNSLAFTTMNFSKDAERNHIMSMVCEATRCEDVNVRAAAFECIQMAVELFYSKMKDYMQTLFEISFKAIKTEEKVGLQAIEFFSTLCEVEMDVMEELENIDDGQAVSQENQCMHYIAASLDYLIPILLECMTKQDEDAIEDGEWNIASASATCLILVANTVQDKVVQHVMPFVTTNINNTDWRMKEASITAFSSILEGPSQESLANYVSQSITILLDAMKDPNTLVRESATYAIGQIFEEHVQSIPPEILPTVIEQLCKMLLSETPKVASQSCSAIHKLASQVLEKTPDAESNVLSPFMPHLLQTLMQTTERNDWDEHNLRIQAYEAINTLICCSATNEGNLIAHMLPAILDRIKVAASLPANSNEEKETKEQLQGLLTSCVCSIVRKIGDNARPYADQIMKYMIESLKIPGASFHEEAYVVVGAMADIFGLEFMTSMEYVQPLIIQGLKNHEAYGTCSAAVGVVGDISRAITGQMAPFCEPIIIALMEGLQSATLDPSVKGPILSCFGDIALAIGGQFERYLAHIMDLLMKQHSQVPDPDDEDDVYYCNLLREGLFEAYTGIIQGLKDDNKQELIAPYVDAIISFLEQVTSDVSRDEPVVKAAVAYLGDLSSALGPRMKPFLQRQFVSVLLNDAQQLNDPSFAETLQWARDVITSIVQS